MTRREFSAPHMQVIGTSATLAGSGSFMEQQAMTRREFSAPHMQVNGTSATLEGSGSFMKQQAAVTAVATVLFGAEVARRIVPVFREADLITVIAAHTAPRDEFRLPGGRMKIARQRRQIAFRHVDAAGRRMVRRQLVHNPVTDVVRIMNRDG